MSLDVVEMAALVYSQIKTTAWVYNISYNVEHTLRYSAGRSMALKIESHEAQIYISHQSRHAYAQLTPPPKRSPTHHAISRLSVSAERDKPHSLKFPTSILALQRVTIHIFRLRNPA